MNRQILALALVAALSAPVAGYAKKNEAKDPILMTVKDIKVPLSEFVYLYNKNKSQQHDTLTVDEYLPLFIDYKLKVADAVNDKIDTLDSFKKEFNGYRKDLFRPYLEDKATLDSLVNEAYARMVEQVSVSHIMIGKGQTPEDDAKAIALADSLYKGVTEGTLDFVETALKYSIDQSVRHNNGSTGYFSGGRFPYSFESAGFNTPVGQYAPLTETKYGRHIIRVDGRRTNPGEVHVRHILLLTQGKDSTELPKIENTIYNLHQLLLAGSDFASMARKMSEDPGSARNGGELPWFGQGQMVPEFEKVAFELADSTLSEPFKTSYGWHIIQKLGHRAVKQLDEQQRDALITMMSRDARAQMPREVKMAKLRARFNASVKEQNLETLKMAVNKAGRLDSALLDIFTVNPMVFAVVDGQEYTCDEVLGDLDLSKPYAADMAVAMIDAQALEFVNEKVVDLEMARLEREDKDFANLLREYSDGMLMFEQSNRKVWEAANSDVESLQAYFDANRAKYHFDTPKFKGIVVMTANDSITALAKEYIKTNNVGIDSLAQVLRKNVDKVIRVEKVLVEKGKNQAVDEDIFGEPKAAESKGRFKSHFIYEGKLIEEPEEIADVRTQLITDYQNELNNRWVSELKKKYPVKVNKKVLKQVK